MNQNAKVYVYTYLFYKKPYTMVTMALDKVEAYHSMRGYLISNHSKKFADGVLNPRRVQDIREFAGNQVFSV